MIVNKVLGGSTFQFNTSTFKRVLPRAVIHVDTQLAKYLTTGSHE